MKERKWDPEETYDINEKIFTGRCDILSCVIETYRPDRPSKKSNNRSFSA